MKTNRRTFVKTIAAGAAALTVPLLRGAEPSAPAAPLAGPPPPPAPARLTLAPPALWPAGQFATSPRASVLVSGGAIMRGNHFQDHVKRASAELYGPGRKILLVLHASLPGERDAMERRLQEAFADCGGCAAESIHHWTGDAALEKIAAAGAFFVGGGETFLLLRTLYETGQLAAIRERVLAGAPYHGTSAGANVAGTVIGTTNDFPVTDVPGRAAFGIFPAVINPHHPPVETPDGAGRAWKIRHYLTYNVNETVLGLGNAVLAWLRAGEVARPGGPGPAYLYHGAQSRPLAPGAIPELTALAGTALSV